MSLTHLVLESLSDDALDAACKQRLESRGYVCEIPKNWERINHFARRMGLRSANVFYRLNDPRCPLPSSCIQRAPSSKSPGKPGRRSHIAPTALFEDFCRRRTQ